MSPRSGVSSRKRRAPATATNSIRCASQGKGRGEVYIAFLVARSAEMLPKRLGHPEIRLGLGGQLGGPDLCSAVVRSGARRSRRRCTWPGLRLGSENSVIRTRGARRLRRLSARCRPRRRFNVTRDEPFRK